MLDVCSIMSGYGRIPIIHGISFKVHEGEALGIFGHNGMGKTTLLKTLAGHLGVKAGKIRLRDIDISRSRPDVRARLGVGYVPQGRGIFPKLTVLENLRIGALAAKAGDDAVDTVLEDFPRLKPILNRAGGVLSGGEQQILALGRCLCSRPMLILLDEPTEGIQPSIIDELIILLKKLKKRDGLTIVLVEQRINFIQELSDRVLLIQRGQIRGEMQPDQLKDKAFVEQILNIGDDTIVLKNQIAGNPAIV